MRRVSPELVREMRRLVREGGYTAKDVAYEVGVCPATVWGYTSDIPRNRSVREPYGEKMRRFVGPRDPEREARIVAAAERETLEDIAAREGVTRERVRQIVAAYCRRTGIVIKRPPRSQYPAKQAQQEPTLAQRLLSHASLTPDGCWKWTGARAPLVPGGPLRCLYRPHAKFKGPLLAPRHSYVLWREPDIGTKQIYPAVCGDHDCINPYHWERRARSLS